MIEGAVPAVLNHLLNQAGWARHRLAPFAGRQVSVSMPPWQVRLKVVEDGWFAAGSEDAVADVDIALPAETPLLALQGMDKVLHSARIEGGAQFAGELAYVLKNLRWDYEEDLSRLFGDIAAHRLAGGFAAFGAWQKRAAERLAQGVARLASERTLAKRPDGIALAADLTGLDGAISRLERRVEALAARTAGKA